MEKNKNGLIVMTGDGQFLEIKNHISQTEIGQEIEVKNITNHNSDIFRKVASIAAAIIIFLSGGYGIFGYHTVYGYVDVDINPRVELSYNLYKRVIGVRGLNEDGENILMNVKDYKNKPIGVVINKVIDSAIKENYIKENDENAVLVTITESKNEIDDNKILEEIDTHIKDSSIKAEVVVIKSDKKSYEEAKKDNISPGKTKLIEKAADENKNINPSEIKDKSVKEIMSIIKESRKENKKEDRKSKREIRHIEREKKEIEKNTRKMEKEKEKKESKLDVNKEKEKDRQEINKDNKKENRSNKRVKENKNNKENKENKENNSKNNSKDRNQYNNKNSEKNKDKNNKSKGKQTNNSKKNNSGDNSRNNPKNRK